MSDAMIVENVRDLLGPMRSFVARRVPTSDVDDVLQDIFLRMHRSANRDQARIQAWAYRIAHSAVADFYRLRPDAAVDIEVALENAHEDEDDENAVERELAVCVAPFVAALPSPYREALTLTELQGCSQREAAAKLGVSLPGMKSRVQRARAKLRELFDDCCSIETDARGRVVDYTRRPNPCPCSA
jgi:RNA polymerase sigma-70 factor (ECF subfamily)